MARTADFDLSRAVTEAGFTPSRRDLAGLIELAGRDDDDLQQHATRALTRLPGDVVVPALEAQLRGDEARASRLAASLGVVARAHPGAGGDAALATLLGDEAAPSRARRAAAVALGKIGGDAARAALLTHWDRDLTPDHRRAVAEALGKVGGDEAVARLRQLAPGGDAELGRRRDRAILMIERGASRGVDSEVDLTARPPHALSMIARCRAGLEALLVDELREQGLAPEVESRGVVRVALDRPLATLWAARTLVTAGLAVPLPRGELAEAIAIALSEDRTFAAITALTRGPVRWRLDFAGGGHRRAVVWRAAREVAARRPALINDPTSTTWDVVVDEDAGRLELRPRRFADQRFTWRVRDVPAASHPTLAAAIARTAGVRADDVVWDPFVGSGAELIERARLGPFARLIGTDLDARALEAAAANLEAAELTAYAELAVADATTHRPRGVTLILSNPPLGRRLRGDAPALLETFIAHAASVLVRGGRLVWITPVAARTAKAARAAGLRAGPGVNVDLGGFEGRLETWTRP